MTTKKVPKAAKRPAPPEIKAVIFDLGGVIMSGGYLAFLHHYCLQCLTRSGKEIIDDLEHQVNLGTITEQQFYRAIRQVFSVHLTPKQMHNQIVSKMQVNKSLVKFIPKIKQAKVALFTNSIGHMAIDVLHKRGVPVRKTFDKLFLSNKIHLAKPDAKAYRHVIKNLKIHPRQALMVDDRKENITAAKKVGMQGIVFKNTAQFKKELAKYRFQ
jgi:putative hydrolase of the HAD superfamily